MNRKSLQERLEEFVGQLCWDRKLGIKIHSTKELLDKFKHHFNCPYAEIAKDNKENKGCRICFPSTALKEVDFFLSIGREKAYLKVLGNDIFHLNPEFPSNLIFGHNIIWLPAIWQLPITQKP